jgi:DMSO reductase anchor subunit
VKKIVYLFVVALVAMLILVPTAMAQLETTTKIEQETTQPLPKSGGVNVGASTVLVPAAALLLGAGVLGYATLRRRH